MIDSHHQTREAAMDAAKLLHAEGHLEGVKVIKDMLDEKSGMSKELVVFDTSKARKAAAPPPKTGVQTADVKAAPPSETKNGSTTGTALKSIMWLAILLVLAGGVLYVTGGLGRR
ncbi:MAG: hypothetical protein EXQ92_06605 [Alphaproteobacteria bacterium]|nr:hypothetical protein [Alphaproteobacteria bacterium]